MAFLLIGCGSDDGIKADTKLVCELLIESSNQSYESYVEIKYNKDKNEIVKGTFKLEYKNSDGIDKGSTELQNIRNRQAILSGVSEGVTVTLDTTDISFSLVEKWNYLKVNVEEAMQMDSRQEAFIKDGKYSVANIKEYYENQGFTCKEKKIK